MNHRKLLSIIMYHDSSMIRLNTLIKNLWVVLLPAVLTSLLVFQWFRCGNVLNRRNSYLLESLPVSTDWAWDALSGKLYPYLYAEDDQPGGMHANRFGPPPGAPGGADNKKPNYAELKEKWLQDNTKHRKEFRESVLIPGLPSLTVHYLWCANGHFELSHYIAILSALHQFRPDKMIIHYLVKPRKDPQGYWRWLEDLERDIVLLRLKPLKNPQHCSHDLSAGVDENDFPDAHGVFLLGDVAITNLTRPDVIRLMAQSFLGGPEDKISISHLDEEKWRKSQLFVVSNSEPYHISQSPGRVVLACPPVTDFNTVKNLDSAPCVSIQSYFYSEELLRKESRFFRYARTLLYGSPNPINLQIEDQKKRVPNIFHIILTEEEPRVTPLLYVSIKSAYKNGKVDKVYVHSQRKPTGELWDQLFLSDNLEPVFVPTGSYMNPDSKHAPMSYMLYTLLQHGGMASFGDAVFVKPVSSSTFSTSAAASLHRSQYRQKHRTLNTAVLVAEPGSEFIRTLLGMVHQSANSWPDMNPDDIATHLLEVNARYVIIDSQVTAHQECNGNVCQIAGGHDPPGMVFTTRLIWKSDAPETLEQLSKVQGPFNGEMHKLINS